MKKGMAFGDVAFAKKMALEFGETLEPVKAEMSYAEDVETFIRKIQNAHKQAYKSKVVFG